MEKQLVSISSLENRAYHTTQLVIRQEESTKYLQNYGGSPHTINKYIIQTSECREISPDLIGQFSVEYA